MSNIHLTVQQLLNIAAFLFGGIGTVAASIQLYRWRREWIIGRSIDFAGMETLILELKNIISGQNFTPDFVLGIGRSGAILGGFMAGCLEAIPVEVMERTHPHIQKI